MRFFSDIQNYHSVDEHTNENIETEFGTPIRTLYTELDPGDLHQRIEVKDEQGQVLYWTKSSIVVIRGKTDIFDADGKQVAHLEKKPISLHEKHYITMADGRQFTLSNELLHIFKDITNIQGLNWKIKGNIIGLNFTLFDEHDEVIAAIGQKIVSVHDRYSIDLYQTQHEQVVAAILISLQKMLTSRRERNR